MAAQHLRRRLVHPRRDVRRGQRRRDDADLVGEHDVVGVGAPAVAREELARALGHVLAHAARKRANGRRAAAVDGRARREQLVEEPRRRGVGVGRQHARLHRAVVQRLLVRRAERRALRRVQRVQLGEAHRARPRRREQQQHRRAARAVVELHQLPPRRLLRRRRRLEGAPHSATIAARAVTSKLRPYLMATRETLVVP